VIVTTELCYAASWLMINQESTEPKTHYRSRDSTYAVVPCSFCAYVSTHQDSKPVPANKKKTNDDPSMQCKLTVNIKGTNLVLGDFDELHTYYSYLRTYKNQMKTRYVYMYARRTFCNCSRLYRTLYMYSLCVEILVAVDFFFQF
jgi:hypothetical protein